MRRDRRTLQSLQVLRACAAVAVLFYHVWPVLRDYFDEQTLEDVFRFGRCGVQLFFVLSGFIIFWVHHADIGAGWPAARAYMHRRVARIYPAYWILSLTVLGAGLLLPGAIKAYKLDVAYLAESFALVRVGHMRGNPIIPPAWTLFHEMKFYAFFGLLILIRSRRLRTVVTAVVAAVTLAVVVCRAAAIPVEGLVAFYFGEYNLLFAAGVLAAWLIQRRGEGLPYAALVWISAGTFLLVGAMDNLLHWPELQCNLFYGISSFLLIVAVVGLERGSDPDAASRSRARALLLVGDASYSIYLLHYPLYTAFAILLCRTHVALPLPLTVACQVLLGLVGGCLMYLLIERPLLRVLKRACITKADLARITASDLK